jgi:ribonuclease J
MADKITFFALGGLDENGKNMYVIEINDDIYVVEAGLKYPDSTRPGIDFVIPDVEYLKQNRHRVKAYIISHGHDDQFGAIPFIYDSVPAPIYGTEATLMMLKRFINKAGFINFTEKCDMRVIDFQNPVVEIAGRTFIFFQTTHNMMYSCGFAVDTSEGYVIYTGNFIVEYNASDRYRLGLNEISKIAEKGVLCLLCESRGAERSGYTSPTHRLEPHIDHVIRDATGRVYVALYEQSPYNIEELVNITKKYNRKLMLYNENVDRYFRLFSNHGLDLCPANLLITRDEIFRVTDDKLVILLLNNGKNIFNEINDLALNRHNDKRFVLGKNDTFIMACPPPPNLEVLAMDALDNLYIAGAKVTYISSKILNSMHAQQEDIRMMISLCKPKYFIPIIGLYRHQIAGANIALNTSRRYNHTNVFLLDNGVPVVFENGVGKVLYQEKDRIHNGDLMVDGTGIGDTNRGVLEDRLNFSEDGVIILGLVYSLAERKIVAGPDVQMRGFVYLRSNEALLKQVIKIFVDTVNTHLKSPNVDIGQMSDDVKQNVERYIYHDTRRRPVVISLIHQL